MSMLWTSEALVAAMDGRPLGPMPEGISGISIDSRSLQPGDAFFAIKGEAMDGHDFATAAIKAGAGVLVVAEGKLPSLGRLTAPIIVVEDVLVEASRWVDSLGVVMWDEGELASAHIEADVAAGQFYVAEIDGDAAGVIRFQLEDQAKKDVAKNPDIF